MWISEDINISDEAYESKSGAIRINVYANSSRDMASNKPTTPVDTSLERVTANDTYLFKKVEVPEEEEEEQEFEYTLNVPNRVNTLDIDAIASNMDATVEITKISNTLAYYSPRVRKISNSTAAQHNDFSLDIGDNFFKVVVTSSDRTKKQDHILKVTREAPGNASLFKLDIEGYSLDPIFDKDITEYTLSLEANTIKVNATAADEYANVAGTGTHKLSWGDNLIEITVTADNGAVKVYKIIVTNVRPDAPTIKGGGSWVSTPPNISIENNGMAISGVKEYEYYITKSSTLPTDETKATGTTSDTIKITNEGTNYVYYRTVSKTGNKSAWSNVQIAKYDITLPEVEYTATVSANNIQVTIDNIIDTLSGPSSYSKTTLKYSDVEGSYTENAQYIGNGHYISGLGFNKTYYFKLCVYDNAGNEKCVEDSKTTAPVGTVTLAFINIPTSSSNGYLKKKTVNVNYKNSTGSTSNSLYYYVKSTRLAKSSVSTTYTCGTGEKPIDCVSQTGGNTLTPNTWYRYESKPTITYDETSTTVGTIYVVVADGEDMTNVASGEIDKIDATEPIITINNAVVDQETGKINIEYDLKDAHSGVQIYSCNVYQENTAGTSTSNGASMSISNSMSSSMSVSATPSISTSVSGSTSTDTITTTASETSCSATVDTTKDYVGYKVCVTDKVGNSTTCEEGVINSEDYNIACTFDEGDVIQTFNTPGSYGIKVPCSGEYKLEVYGAEGSTYNKAGGKGGYATGNVKLSANEKIYIGVGGSGSSGSNNGGGKAPATSANGGGATHIALGTTNRGELKNYEDYQSEVLIVAGGGGAGGYYGVGGAGGGTTGNSGIGASSGSGNLGGGTGGTQTSGYAFGEGGSCTSYLCSAGGGGWYGGGASRENTTSPSNTPSGGGGSGYVGGVTNGTMSNGVRSGNGYAVITLVKKIDNSVINKVEVKATTESGAGVNTNNWISENVLLTASIEPTETIGEYLYQWYRNGEKYGEKSTANTLTVSTTGTYKLTVTNSRSNATKTSDEINIKIDTKEPTCVLQASGTLYNDIYTGNITVSFKEVKDMETETITGSGVTLQSIDYETVTENVKDKLITGTVTDESGKVGMCQITVTKDNVTPTVTAKEETNYITTNTNKAITDYYNISTGPAGGTTTCKVGSTTITNTNNLSQGVNTVTCTTTGNNGKTSSTASAIFRHEYTATASCASNQTLNSTNTTCSYSVQTGTGTSYNCNSYPGYTLSGTSCVKTTTTTDTTSVTCSLYKKCNVGEGKSCASQIINNACAGTANSLGTVNCDSLSGYPKQWCDSSTYKRSSVCGGSETVSGADCANASSKKCPSGYTMNGTTCTKTTTTTDTKAAGSSTYPIYGTNYANPTYTCPTNGINGNTGEALTPTKQTVSCSGGICSAVPKCTF